MVSTQPDPGPLISFNDSYTQIRNVATLGGNIVTASPISDMNPVLIAAGATLRIASAESARTVTAAAFFKGYRKVDLQQGEVLLSIFVPW